MNFYYCYIIIDGDTFVGEKINIYLLKYQVIYLEASRGAAVQSVTVKPTSCGFDPHSSRT